MDLQIVNDLNKIYENFAKLEFPDMRKRSLHKKIESDFIKLIQRISEHLDSSSKKSKGITKTPLVKKETKPEVIDDIKIEE